MRRPVTDAVDGLDKLLSLLLELRTVEPVLSLVAAATLVYLGLQTEHEARMSELQRMLGISQQRTGALCHSLARRKLVRLTPFSEDRRSVRVQLTDKSLRLIGK